MGATTWKAVAGGHPVVVVVTFTCPVQVLIDLIMTLLSLGQFSNGVHGGVSGAQAVASFVAAEQTEGDSSDDGHVAPPAQVTVVSQMSDALAVWQVTLAVAATLVQVPSRVPPFFVEHAMQSLVSPLPQALEQQTPSTQVTLLRPPQSATLVHGAPKSIFDRLTSTVSPAPP